MDNLCLARNVQNLVKGEEDAELLLVLALLELLEDLLKDSIRLLLVLLQILIQLNGCLLLHLMHF